jgi:hypothetical protein
MNLFWGCGGKYDSVPTFRICAQIQNLAALQEDWGADSLSAKLFFAAHGGESFSLRETRRDVSLRTFAAPTALETSAD